LAGLRISYEKENDLVTAHNYISKVGMEIGFREFIFLRAGNVNPKSTDSFNTIGIGLDPGVLLNRIYLGSHFSSNDKWYIRAIRNLNLRIDYSHYSEGGESPFPNGEFINIGLSL
jgi:hypothetical protein